MPAGLAVVPGRSGAKSIDDAEHGASIKSAIVRCLDLHRHVASGDGRNLQVKKLLVVAAWQCVKGIAACAGCWPYSYCARKTRSRARYLLQRYSAV
jgi:hypothetical protein